jgi:hypothetical protein
MSTEAAQVDWHHVTVERLVRPGSMDISSHPFEQPALAIPAELAATGQSGDVAVVYDLDHLSYFGAGGTRVDNATLAALTDLVEDAASALGNLRYIRAACSTETAFIHRFVLSGAANNTWQAVTGRDGADACVIAELDHLAQTRRMRVVVLVAGEHAYADPVATLRSAGIAVWVLYRRGSLSWRLYRAATAATPLPPGTTTAALLRRRPSRLATFLGARQQLSTKPVPPRSVGA